MGFTNQKEKANFHPFSIFYASVLEIRHKIENKSYLTRIDIFIILISRGKIWKILTAMETLRTPNKLFWISMWFLPL